MNFPVGFVVFFIISLGSEEQIPKQLKQISIIGRMQKMDIRKIFLGWTCARKHRDAGDVHTQGIIKILVSLIQNFKE